MINYLSKINYLSIKLITCQNKLIADQKMIDDYTKTVTNLLLTKVYVGIFLTHSVYTKLI